MFILGLKGLKLAVDADCEKGVKKKSKALCKLCSTAT